MKIEITEASKIIITLLDLPKVTQIIDMFAERDDEKENEMLDLANFLADGHQCEIWQGTAEIAKNNRVWDAYDEGSRDLDVWIDITMRTSDAFFEAGAYVTDIWQIGSVDASELRNRMYIREFREVKRNDRENDLE